MIRVLVLFIVIGVKMNLPKFKIRASQIGSIMGKMSGGITDKQQEELTKLLSKPLEGKGCLTESMKTKIKELNEKKTTVKGLPKGCKTYLKTWVKEQIYGRRKEVTSKYMDKGNICEDEALRMLMEYYNLPFGYEKNEVYYENEYMTGTPDLDYPDTVYDSKCSFDMSTFPLFETDIDKDYWWQLQGYMELLNKPKAGLVYVLVNTPDHIVDMEIRNKTYGWVHEAMIKKKAEEIRAFHNYDDIEMKYRIKKYDFLRDEQAIMAVQERVTMCRKYITELVG